jgi:ADP-ribose pyrophosphatase
MNDHDEVRAKRVYECPIFYVEEEITPQTSSKRYAVRHPGAVVFLPITAAGSMLLVRQHRMPLGRELLEAPAGTLEIGEEPLGCAQREIQEEVGMQAERWESLGTLYPAPGFCDEVQHLFVARELTPSHLPADDDEEITVVEMMQPEVLTAIRTGEICDGKTLAIILKAQLLGLF